MGNVQRNPRRTAKSTGYISAAPSRAGAAPLKPPRSPSYVNTVLDPINAAALANIRPASDPITAYTRQTIAETTAADPITAYTRQTIADAKEKQQSPDGEQKSPDADKPAYFDDLAPFYEAPVVSLDPALADWYRFDPKSAADASGFETKAQDYAANVKNILHTLEDRFREGYLDTYRDDADSFAEAFDYVLRKLSDTAYSLLNDVEALRGVYGDAWANETIANIKSDLNSIAAYAGTVAEDAAFWAQFEDAADYGAAMFNADMFEKYGGLTYTEAKNKAAANEQIIGSPIAPPELISEKLKENHWLAEYARSVMTSDDVKREIEEKYKRLDELLQAYNPGDTTSYENNRLAYEIGQIYKELPILESWAYEYDMNRMLDALPTELKNALLNIPYLEDNRIKLYNDAAGDQSRLLAAEQYRQKINSTIAETKQSLKDLGYSNTEISDLITYAELLHDKAKYEEHLKEKIAYAKAHPVAASIGSVIENFAGPLDELDTLIQVIRNAITGRNVPISDYTPIKQITGGAAAVRDTVADMIKESTGSSFLSGLYKGGMTAADLLAQAALPGGGLGFADDAVRGATKAASSTDDLAKLLAIPGNADDVLKTIATGKADDFVKTIATSKTDDFVKAIATGKSDDLLKVITTGKADDILKAITSGKADDFVKAIATGKADNLFEAIVTGKADNVLNAIAKRVGKSSDEVLEALSRALAARGDDTARVLVGAASQHGDDLTAWADDFAKDTNYSSFSGLSANAYDTPDTPNPKINNPLDDTHKPMYTEGAGEVIGSLDGLTQSERNLINDLVKQGKQVEIIPRSNVPRDKTPDVKVNGVKTEFKTLNGTSLNTPIKRIREGFGQGAEVVIIDARATGLTAEQAKTVINRINGIYRGNIPGKIEIWTKYGIIYGGK